MEQLANAGAVQLIFICLLITINVFFIVGLITISDIKRQLSFWTMLKYSVSLTAGLCVAEILLVVIYTTFK